MAKIQTEKLALKGASIVAPFSSQDDRGLFVKLCDEEFLRSIPFEVKEMFYSVNKKNSLRGLHYLLPSPQSRMVFCTSGSIYDVLVDLRQGSPSFKKWEALKLSAQEKKGVLIPKGFAHGFLSLQEGSTVLYLADEKHVLEHDKGIAFDDPELAIGWPVKKEDIIVSARDRAFPMLKDAQLYD